MWNNIQWQFTNYISGKWKINNYDKKQMNNYDKWQMNNYENLHMSCKK